MSENSSSTDSARVDTRVVGREDKPGLDVEVSNTNIDNDVDFFHAANGQETHSTSADVRHMKRMGKDQQLVRNFRLLSMASFTTMATAAWELSIFVITPALVNGGRAGMMYSIIWTFIAAGPVYFSLAEMASMAPVAGAQYHWVSEFAPERYQRILSYLTGWTSTLAWQAGNAFGVFIVGTLAQAVITINVPDYDAPAWHATLLVIGASLLTLAANVLGSRILHVWQTPLLIVHIAFLFVLIVPIWVKVPQVSHDEVWRQFEDFGGWPTMALAVLAGQLTGISGQTGIDTAAHMSEEVKDGAKQVPKVMIIVYLLNFVVTFPTLLTLAYHIDSIEDSLNDPTTYPVIYVLRQTFSTGGLTAILIIINVILEASNVTYLAAVTRDLFAFARDNGLPFSPWISRVDKKRAIPVNSAILSTIIAIALSLIYLGSPVAFYAITSLVTVALLQCYCLSIGCVLWRRIYHPETLPPADFSLGRWGIPTNIAAVLFSFWGFFWSFWPNTVAPSAADFNWASPLFVATLVVAMVYFVFRGRHAYRGPVVSVEGRKLQ